MDSKLRSPGPRRKEDPRRNFFLGTIDGRSSNYKELTYPVLGMYTESFGWDF